MGVEAWDCYNPTFHLLLPSLRNALNHPRLREKQILLQEMHSSSRRSMASREKAVLQGVARIV